MSDKGPGWLQHQIDLAQKSMETWPEYLKGDSSYHATRKKTPEDIAVGEWLSAALDDPIVCETMKEDIRNWFNQFKE